MAHAAPPEDRGPLRPGPPLPAGTSSVVRGVTLPDGTAAVLKRFRSHRAWSQARRALEEWGPACGPELRVPSLLAVDPEGPLTLLIERLDGVRADQPGWRTDTVLARRLGRGLRALHAVGDTDADPLSLQDACARRMSGWLSQGKGDLEPDLIAAVQRRFDPSALAGRVRRVCHRDAEPYNLLLADGQAIALVDFEHARMDDPLLDIVSTWDGRPLGQSPFTAALVTAWGHPAPPPALRCWGLLHGVATLCKARQEGNIQRAAQARDSLIQITRSPEPE